MQKIDAITYLAGVEKDEIPQADAPTNIHIITGEVSEDSEDGVARIEIDGFVISGDDDDEQSIEIDTLGGLEEGDTATILLAGETGKAMTPLAIGAPGSLDRMSVRISEIEADYIKTTQLEAAEARIGDLEADHVSTTDLNAATARIGTIEADYLKAADMTAEQARVGTLLADYTTTTDLQATYATITNLNAATGRISTLEANDVTISGRLTAAEGNITNLQSSKADISVLESDYITADAIEAAYTKTDFSNTDVAWIQNGVIKDGSISSAMINDVSANKLTAGTINGSVINVTNLNASNITTGTINGQRIGEGSLSLSKLEDDVYTESEVDSIVSNLQTQIDGAIETWTGTAVPTLSNQPASSWTTNAIKDTHVGDVYFVVNSNSQQNGYNYRFTKSGNTYSWQLIKDSDVTNALQRLSTAEGKITTFDSDISQLKTDTGTLTTKTTSLETRMSDAEADILDKVDTTTFNEVSDTVDSHTQSITQMSTTISNKADSSTVSSLTTRVSKNEQDISGINTTIGSMQTTIESKADGSTVSTISNKLNTVSDTVDGHTQSISSITSTQTTMQGKLDKTLVETTQLWYSKANTTAPNKPTAQVTSTSTDGNAWRVVVPAYNASYPNYYYCYQWKYSDGTYGWSSVTRDIAMGESQERARTAITNAASAQSTANTANTNASSAVSTANTASTNASNALSTANTAASDASDAKADAATAVSTANTANTNASAAVSTANTASTNASTAVSTANTAKSTADTAKATADKNVKSTTQLWFTKSNETAPAKPTAKVTSTAVSGNGWRVVVPTYASDYPYYFYCYQYELADGTFTWSDVVYDRATTENQSNSRSAVSGVSTLTTKTNTIQDTVDGHTQSLQSITQTQTSIQQNAVKSTVQLWFTKANTTAPNKPTEHVTTNNATTGNAWNLAVPTYNSSYPNYYYCYEYQYIDGSYGWSAVTRDIATGEAQSTARTAASDASSAVSTANTANTNASNAVSTANTANTNASNAVSTANTANTNASNAVSTANTAAADASTAKTDAASAVSTANTASTNASAAVSTANAAQATADKNVRESQQLWFTKANSTAPDKPTSKVTSTATTGNAWTTRVPTYNDSYKHYFYCMQYIAADGTVTWSDVIYDQATTEAQQLANTTSASLTTLQEDYATYKQTTTENVSSIGTRLTTAEGKISNAETAIEQTANNVLIKATESDTTAAEGGQHVIQSLINVAPSGVTINADKVNIEGAAIFTSGRLSEESLNDTLNDRIGEVKDIGVNMMSDVMYGVTSSEYQAFYAYITEPLRANETYTLQLWNVDVSHTGKSASTLGIGVFYCGGSVRLDNDQKLIGTDYFTNGHADHISLTFTFTESWAQHSNVTSNHNMPYIRIYNSPQSASGTMSLTIGKWKLEHGSVGTEWSKTGIAYARGGRNLLASDTFTRVGVAGNTESLGPVSLGTIYSNFSTSTNGIYTGFETGEQYTFRVGLEVADTSVEAVTTVGPIIRFVYTDDTSDEWRFRYRISGINYGVLTSDPTKNISKLILSYSNNGNCNWTFHEMKLERGGTATEYSFAPEDTDAAIDNVQDNLDASRAWYAECSTAAATAAKVATITPATTDFTLTTGVVVNVKFSVTNTGAVGSLTLNVNGTGAKSIKTQRSNSLTNLGHAGVLYQNAVIPFVYNGQYWLAIENYNSDTYNRTRMQNVITAATAITASHIICGTSAGYKNIAAGVQFDLSYPLLYAGSAIAAAGTGDNNFLQINSINAANNGTIETGTNYSTLYLKGTVAGNLFTIAASPFLTTVQPTTENGFFYIPLGVFYNSTTNIYFNSSKDLYAYLDGRFRQVTPTEIMASQRIYYRSKVSGTVPKPTAWVTLATNKYNDTVSVGNNGWSTKVTPIASSTAENVTKYLYLYTCEQRKRLDGTVECTAVTLDENTTIIDGGNIITHTVTADQLNATSINASKSLTVGAMTDDAASTILNSNVQVGGRNLLRNTENPTTSVVALTRSTISNGIITLTPTTSAAYSKWKVDYLDYADYSGKTVTFSLDIRMADVTSSYTAKQAKLYVGVCLSTRVDSDTLSSSYDRYSPAYDVTDITSEWKRFYVTKRVPDDLTSGQASALSSGNFLTVQAAAVGSSVPIEARRFKLEIGNVATDWTPAPEDVDADIAEAAKTATNYIEQDSTGIKIRMTGNTSTYQHQSANGTKFYVNGAKRSEVGADGLKVYIGSANSEVSVAEFGSVARVGAENKTHITISSSESTSGTQTDETSEIKLYDATGAIPNLRLYDETSTYNEGSSPVTVESVGIDLGNGGRESTGASIESYINSTETSLNIRTGNTGTTRGSYARLESSRRWSTDSTKLDVAVFSTNVHYGGNSPFANITVQSGSKSASFGVYASSSASEVGANVDRFTLNGVGCYMTHGSVGQTINATKNAVTVYPASGYISYGHDYGTSTPDVVVGFYSTSTAAGFGGLTIAVSERTATGFKVKIFNNTTTDRAPGFFWIAMG